MNSNGRLGDFMETRMHQQNEIMDMPDLEMVMKKELATDSKTKERELDTNTVFIICSCQVKFG